MALAFAGFFCLTNVACSSKDKESDDNGEVEKVEKVTSDPEIEQMLDGTWTCYHSWDEDGVSCSMNMRITYDASNHTFQESGSSTIEGMSAISFECNGTWSANKDKLYEDTDVDNADISISSYFSEDISEKDLRREMKRENPLTSKIISLTETELVLDEDGEQTVWRKD